MTDVLDLANALFSELTAFVGHKDVVSSIQPNLSRLESIQALDAVLAKSRCLVGELLNRYHPLHRLPPEIMTHIFSLVPADPLCVNKASVAWIPRSVAGRTHDILPLTKVCHHWRNIVLETSRLWSTIEQYGDAPGKRPHFMDYIHRCQRGPLYVHVHGDPHEDTLAILARHGERVRDLCFCYATRWREAFYTMLSFKGDNLRNCSLSLGTLDNPHGPPLQPFFQDYTPQLHSLRLERTPYLPSNRFPTLTHLTLECSWRIIFTFRDLQTFIANCPNLQSLHLGMLGASRMEAPTTAGAINSSIHFPHLRRFSVLDDLRPSRGPALDDPISPEEARRLINRSALHRALLFMVVLPVQCILYIVPVLSRDLNTYANHISKEPRDLSSMRIIDGRQSYASLGSGAISLQLVNPTTCRGVRFDVQVRGCDEAKATIQQNLRLAISTSPLFAHVRELWIGTGAIEFFYVQDSLLHSLPRLRFLQIWCSAMEDHRLYAVLEVLTPPKDGPVLCPELEALCVLVSGQRHTTRLRRLLLRRAQMGHPLQRLHIVWDVAEDIDEGPVEDGSSIAESETSSHGSREAKVYAPSPSGYQEARELGELVEHFRITKTLNRTKPPRFPRNSWVPSWDDRVPPECRAAEEMGDYWPVWEHRAYLWDRLSDESEY